VRKKITIIECIILVIGVLLSIEGTAKAVMHSSSYIPYFGFAALGIVFIILLIVLRKKRFTFIAGICMIVFYLIFAGFAYIVCLTNAARMKRLEYFEGKEVYVLIDDEKFVWTGEGFYRSENMIAVDVRDKSAVFSVDGDTTAISFLYELPGDDDTVYYMIYGGSTGDYLVMHRQ
jgi:uncharacterized membrane protein YgdD (TMEM256/DUF423 family)